MNLYNRINTLMLERLPSMWNTRFPWMILLVLGLHALYFAFGYQHLTLDEMKNYSVREHFFNPFYFSLYTMLVLIIFIYFAFRFYTHNPFRNFYPVSKIYFWKVFMQLFIITFIASSVVISFENGMRMKLKKITSSQELKKEIEEVNLAFPFFYNNKSDYHIDNRIFPAPFPLDEVSDFIIGMDSIQREEIKHGIDLTRPYVVIDGNQYQFGHIGPRKIDSCHSEDVIMEITDVSSVYGLSTYSLYNFNKLYIENQEESRYYNEETYTNGYTSIAPLVHKWQRTKDVKAIENAIRNVEKICKKYKISYLLDAAAIAKAGLEQNLQDRQLLSVGIYDRFASRDYDYYSESSTEDRIDSKNLNFDYSADLKVFSNIVHNAYTLENRMGNSQWFSELLWIFIALAVSFAFFLIITKYIHFREILLGIVVNGMLIAFYSLLYFILFKDSHDTTVMIFSVVYLLAIISLGIYWLLGSKISKPLLSKWLIPFATALLVLLPTLLILIRESTTYTIVNACNTIEKTKYLFELYPAYFLIVELAAIQIIFMILRKWQGRPS